MHLLGDRESVITHPQRELPTIAGQASEPLVLGLVAELVGTVRCDEVGDGGMSGHGVFLSLCCRPNPEAITPVGVFDGFSDPVGRFQQNVSAVSLDESYDT